MTVRENEANYVSGCAPQNYRLHFVYCCVTVTISNSSCFFSINNKSLDIYYNECYWKQGLHFSLNILALKIHSLFVFFSIYMGFSGRGK